MESKVLLILEESVAKDIAQIWSDMAGHDTFLLNPPNIEDVEQECDSKTWDIVPSSTEFIVCISKISALASMEIPNMFQLLNDCINITNQMIFALVTKSAPQLRNVLKSLSQSFGTITPYRYGRIHDKELHTYIFDSIVGPIQIGVPPETIKKSMSKGGNDRFTILFSYAEEVPQIYVLPPKLFADAVNFGEVEFPIYFNFFIKKAFKFKENKIILVGDADQLERVKRIFHESVNGPGPDQIYVSEEISKDAQSRGYFVDLSKEMQELGVKYEGSIAPITHYANFIAWDVNGEAIIHKKPNPKSKGIAFSTDEEEPLPESVEIRIVNHAGLLQFFENSKYVAAVDTNRYNNVIEPKLPDLLLNELSPTFYPPTLGVTFLGTSHGFDPHANTTGFILWVNGQGILVDPPTSTARILKAHGIRAHFVNRVLLTHCHSDHDSGVLMKILEGDKIEVYTTKTINESYKRKMNAITGMEMESFYDFKSVKIGTPMQILGAVWEFDYSYHSIPTLRFKVSYCGKSISYSADTLYDPDVFTRLREKGVISAEREMSLRMFLFDADVIIHESGVPPIHTSIASLNDLPLTIKKKMLVVHCNAIPEKVEKVLRNGEVVMVPVTHLTIPESGFEHTISLPVSKYHEGFSHASRRFKMISDVFFFRRVSPLTLYKLFENMKEVHVKAGAFIIEEGALANSFFLIDRGQAQVIEEGSISCKLRRGDVFGENALRSSRLIPRTASVQAVCDCTLLRIDTQVFRQIIEKDELQEFRIDYDISRVTTNRKFITNVLSNTYLFQDLPLDHVNAIAANLEDELFVPKNTYIIREGDHDASLFIIKSGSVRLERTDKMGKVWEIMRLGVGTMFGEMSLITGLPRTCSALTHEDCRILELKRRSYENLINQYQNLKFRIAQLVDQRLKENERIVNELNFRSRLDRSAE